MKRNSLIALMVLGLAAVGLAVGVVAWRQGEPRAKQAQRPAQQESTPKERGEEGMLVISGDSEEEQGKTQIAEGIDKETKGKRDAAPVGEEWPEGDGDAAGAGNAKDDATTGSIALVGNPLDEASSPTLTTDATPTPQPGTRVSGKVMAPGGGAAAGVTLTFVAQSPQGEEQDYTSTTAVSGEDGSYTANAAPHGPVKAFLNVPPGRFLYAPPAKEIILREGEHREDLNFTLDPGNPIEGIVTTEAGDPIEEARIVATMGGATREATTGLDGRFFLEGVPPNGTLETLTAAHPDYQPETRTNLSSMDGEQRFRLKQSNDIVLAVSWALDRTPVTFYAYRLLKQNSTGLYIDMQRDDIKVESEDGRTVLENVEEGLWRAEVTVLAPDGTPTDIRGSAEFELAQGEKSREIPVEITMGRMISGVVVDAPVDGEAVAGARIEFVPPSAGFGRFPPPDAPFEFPTTFTDSGGYFEFQGMAPGNYTLVAEKEDMVTPEPVDVEVPFGQNPEPLRIVMPQGATVYGQVIDREGNPAGDIAISFSLQRPNADGWTYKGTKTDEDGNYRFSGLTAGSHYVWVRGSELRDNSQFDLGKGEEKEINFDFSGGVSVSGTVYLNGEPAFPKIQNIQFVGAEDRGRRGWTGLEPGGTYETQVQPGEYFVQFAGTENLRGNLPPFSIYGEPQQQEKDFYIESAEVDVIVEFPEGVAFQPGQIVMSPRERSLRYAFVRAEMRQENRHLLNLIAGEYQATFTTFDGQWRGEVDWRHYGPETDNLIQIPLRKTVRGIRLGGWKPGDLVNTAFTTLSFDATPYIESEGVIEIILTYEAGRHAVETGAVRLYRGSERISMEDERGWTGADHWNNSYTLYLDEYEEDASYTIEANLRGDGGSDSTGSVYMNMN